MSQSNKRLFIVLLLTVLLRPLNIEASESNSHESIQENEQVEYTNEDKVNYIRWFGAYDDQRQTPLEKLQHVFETLVTKRDTETTKEEIFELIGEPAETFDVGASEFLVYYSINDKESDILYIQIFSEEKASEPNESGQESNEELEVRAPYLSEVNLMIVGENDFQPLAITSEEIETWQNMPNEEQKFSTIEELIELIGSPSELTYNFEQEVWQFAWIRNSDIIPGLNYLVVEADGTGNIQAINTIQETDDGLESLEYSSMSESESMDESSD